MQVPDHQRSVTLIVRKLSATVYTGTVSADGLAQNSAGISVAKGLENMGPDFTNHHKSRH